MMTQDRLKKEIEDAARYIQTQREQSLEFSKQPDDAAILNGKIERARKKLQAALDELHSIEIQMAGQQRWPAFGGTQPALREIASHTAQALARLHAVRLRCNPDTTGTRELTEQKTALRLAHALVPGIRPHDVRKVALRIMAEAGIQDPAPKTLTNWLRELRNEASAK